LSPVALLLGAAIIYCVLWANHWLGIPVPIGMLSFIDFTTTNFQSHKVYLMEYGTTWSGSSSVRWNQLL
jgi:hypothetical protein